MKTPDPTPPPAPDPAKLDVMSCQQALRQIERMMEDGDLKDVERRLLFTHIRACNSCKQELQRARNLELRLKDTFDALDTRSDFAERILSALPDEDPRPEFRPMPSASASARESNAPTRRYPATPASRAIHRWLWRWRVPLGVAALVCIGLIGARVRFGSFSIWGTPGDADKPPLVTAHGPAILNGQALVADFEHQWIPNEVIKAPPGGELTLTLNFNDAALATVILQPNAALMADNRHSYRLLQGAAFFDVHKDRPRLTNEVFQVAADKFGVARVTGTQFGVEVFQRGATVAVSEGRVEVQAGGSAVMVGQGNQVALVSSKPPSSPVALDHVGRVLARVDGPTLVSVSAPPVSTYQPPSAIAPPPQIVTTQIPPGPPAEFNWEKPLPALPLLLNGNTLSQGLEKVADAFDRPQPLLDLVQQARGPLIAKDATLSFSIHSSMSLREVLVWMARDVGARFELSSDGRAGHIRLAIPEDLPGETSKLDAALPHYVQNKLETRIERAPKPVLIPGRLLPSVLDEMSAATGMTIIADRSAWPLVSNDRQELNTQGQTALHRLDQLILAGALGYVWYDSVVYVAPAARIEALTMQPRTSLSVASLVGNPMNHAWANELLRALDVFKFMPDKMPGLLPGVPYVDGRNSVVARPLIGSPAFYDVSIDPDRPDGPCVLFRSGRLGEAWMAVVLQNLQAPALPFPGPAVQLSEPVALKTVTDLNALVELGKPSVVSRVRNKTFNNSAYVVKGMSVGKTLEWGAWLQGLGVRSDNGTYIIDDATACYGAPPSLQVLSLAPILEQRRELAPELPHAFAALLPQLYPAFFTGVEVRELSGRITFIGDKRHLQLAYELMSALQSELASTAPGANFDISTWRPVWRRDLDRELSELFHGDAESLKRNFAGALRQSGLGLQLRHTIMVDPAAMKEHVNDPVGELDIAGMSVRRVLETLAGVAHLKMEIDGDVIWLKP